MLLKGRKVGTEAPPVWLFLLKAQQDCVQLRLGDVRRDSGAHTAQHDHLVAMAIRLVRHRVRNEEVHRCPGREHGGEVEAGRQHTCHCVGLAIQGNGISNDERICCESPTPEPVGKDHRRRASPASFLHGKASAVDRLYAQYLEEIVGHAEPNQPFGLADPCERVGGLLGEGVEAGESNEGGGPFPEVPQVP